MKIEILYPEIANLYGESANYMYLKKCLPKATFIETSLNNKPQFLSTKIALVYLGASSEEHQELIIKKLMPYKEEIKKHIEDNQLFLATGNAWEIFGQYIENEDGSKIEALNIFDYYSKRNLKHRHNSLFLGDFNDIAIVGYKSQFSHTYNLKNNKFIKVKRGVGSNPNSKEEGIHYKNFFGTYLLGPFLIINPYFTKYLLKLMNSKKPLAFEEASIDAYLYRLKELEDPKTIVTSKHN